MQDLVENLPPPLNIPAGSNHTQCHKSAHYQEYNITVAIILLPLLYILEFFVCDSLLYHNCVQEAWTLLTLAPAPMCKQFQTLASLLTLLASAAVELAQQ